MTKAELVIEISRQTGIDKASVLEVIESLMTTVKDNMVKGENVYLRGFGTFLIKERAEKTARNIKAQTTMIIPAKKIPAFKPSKGFKDEVAK